MVIYWLSTGGKSNPKPNPISFGALNPKTVGEKSSPNPQNLKRNINSLLGYLCNKKFLQQISSWPGTGHLCAL